jgi:hypothetical protein
MERIFAVHREKKITIYWKQIVVLICFGHKMSRLIRPQWTLVIFFLFLFFFMVELVGALLIAMSSSSPRQDAFKKSLAQAASFLPPPPGADIISSSLISQLAVLAIKRRLKEEQSVRCDVAFSSSDLLLNGRVGPVTVSGKSWSSFRGLSCRAIEATVEKCELDAKIIISNRKLLLTTPALGKAMVALNAKDFSNFISHPLMRTPFFADENGESAIEFLPKGTCIDPSSSSVIFSTLFKGQKWNCSLQRSIETKMATVRVFSSNDSTESLMADKETCKLQLSLSLERFFNEMVFELDGTFLSFRDMMVTNRGEAPSVMIALNIRVLKLPSAGTDF